MKKKWHKAFVVILVLLLSGCTYKVIPGGFVYEYQILPNGTLRFKCEGLPKVTDFSVRTEDIAKIIALISTKGLIDQSGGDKGTTSTRAVNMLQAAQESARGFTNCEDYLLGRDKPNEQ